ncbi:MAG: CPBP family intramembrane glutamic endopeptidase [Synechococcus sp.]|nr:CPBP family intramembrane glutamic endopeptidase [Synechococcus sp.]
MPATRSPGRGNPAAAPGWKVLLTLICLALSLLIWFQGLLDSLRRPSVADALSLRQLELSALAAEVVEEPLRSSLFGEEPRAALTRELRRRQQAATSPPLPPAQQLELALLERGRRPEASAGQLQRLEQRLEAPLRPLLQALSRGERLDAELQRTLLSPWRPTPMLSQLVCEQLSHGMAPCPAGSSGGRLLLQLAVVEVLPLPLLLLGVGLLLRQLWLLRQRRLPVAPPLLGPPLSLLDVTLLIAGGFVLLGEVIVPPLLQAWLPGLLTGLSVTGSLQQGLLVLLLYLGLMAAPLLILALMLSAVAPPPPAGGWLQWRWRPPLPALQRALAAVLMVLPAVALCGWLIERLWPNPSGSNPLLDLVLTSSDPWALLCFALTATVLAPLFEETLFRGVLLPVLAQRWGARPAVLASAAVFALAHLSLAEFGPLLVLGIGLGILRWRSGRLGASVLMHAIWNGFTLLNLLVLAN